jgi:iron(III) transport system substrate-binding protein
MKHPFLQCAAALVLLGAAHIAGIAATPAQTARSVAEVATYRGPDRQARLVEGAKREGELSIYYAHPIVPAISEAFSKKYGIKVRAWRAGSEAMTQRLIAEYRAGKNDADVVLNTTADTEAASREKMVQEVWSPYQQNLIAQALPAHHEWTVFNLDIYTAAYNTRLVKKEDLPRSYEDLLDPKWKGRLAVEANDEAWFGSLLGEMGEQRGRALFDKVIATNGMTVRKGHSLLASLVASGEVPLALTVYSWNPDQLKRKGAPIESLFLPPLFANATAIAVMKKAPHPNAAVLFYDFLFSEGQKLMADAGYVPTSKDVDSPARRMSIKFIDPAQELAMHDKWRRLFDETIVKKAR